MKKVLIGLLQGYQKFISPILKQCGVNCKYYPSCSEYMKQAIKKYGCFKGLYLGIKRVLRCHPFAKGGYDPLN